MSQAVTVPPPASAAQALGMLQSAMGYLAAADATAMAGGDPGPVPAGAGAGVLGRTRRCWTFILARVHLWTGVRRRMRITARGRG